LISVDSLCMQTLHHSLACISGHFIIFMSCGDNLSRPADQSSKSTHTSIMRFERVSILKSAGYFQEHTLCRGSGNLCRRYEMRIIAYFYILYSNEAHAFQRIHVCLCSLLAESRRQPFTSAPPICAKNFHNRSSAAKFPRATSISLTQGADICYCAHCSQLLILLE
jgi:hypothetical protein